MFFASDQIKAESNQKVLFFFSNFRYKKQFLTFLEQCFDKLITWNFFGNIEQLLESPRLNKRIVSLRTWFVFENGVLKIWPISRTSTDGVSFQCSFLLKWGPKWETRTAHSNKPLECEPAYWIVNWPHFNIPNRNLGCKSKIAHASQR